MASSAVGRATPALTHLVHRSRRARRTFGTDKCLRRRAFVNESACGASNASDASAGAREETSIRAFLRDRTVVLTGSTGFLAKVFLEKLLWEQPDVRKVFLIIATRGAQTAEDRLREEIIATPLFDRLRERHGADFARFACEKLVPIAGDLGLDGLGLSEADEALVTSETEIVVHSAATTTFDERFDVAVNINALGPRRMLRLSKKCAKLKVMCHVSTAFVNGLRKGNAAERAFKVGDSVANELRENDAEKKSKKTSPGLDPYKEIALAFSARARNDSSAAGITTESGRDSTSNASAPNATCTFTIEDDDGGGGGGAEVRKRLTRLGAERARANGWQDTYVFTKAMGEQILSNEKEDVPLIIVRPSIVEGALREPFPGWIEGVRMADPLILAYGKGLIRGFVGDKKGVLDIVPVDAVVNVMLAGLSHEALLRESRETRDSTMRSDDSLSHELSRGDRVADDEDITVYHVATSTSNPLNFSDFLHIVSNHFERFPLADKKSGEDIQPARDIEVFSTRFAFEVDTWLRQDGVRLTGKSILEKIKPGTMTSADRKRMIVAKKTWAQLKTMGQLYEPYTAYEARFSSTNVTKLRDSMSAEDVRSFPFDLESIDWQQYLSSVHIPGLLKHALRIDPKKNLKVSETTVSRTVNQSANP